MKLIAAYLLALLGGNSSPTAEDLKSVLGSVGAEADDEKLELLFSNLKGKDLGEVLAIGRERFASSGGGGGGGGGVVTAASGGGGGGGAAAPPVEEKKEEKKEEKEESDDDMGFSLFD